MQHNIDKHIAITVLLALGCENCFNIGINTIMKNSYYDEGNLRDNVILDIENSAIR